ncbi:hypothetical protein BsWGS_28968 [Bradybaena similaris]
MEANCLLSSETIKIEPDFETKPSGPLFPVFIKREIKPETDIKVDSESWTNAQEVYSLDRNLQDCKTEAGTRNNEELLCRAKCESVQVQLEDVYIERCLELVNLTNLSHVLPGNNGSKGHIMNNTDCSSRAQDLANNSHVELGIVDSKASLNTTCYDKAIEYVYTKHNNDMLTLHNENWSSESNDMLSMSKVQKQLQTVDKCDVYEASFAQSDTLDRHTVAHTDEKPYKCEDCGALFAHKHNMIEHIKVHNGEMAFKHLTLFTLSSVLKEHKRVCAGEKSYKCDVCGLACHSS